MFGKIMYIIVIRDSKVLEKGCYAYVTSRQHCLEIPVSLSLLISTKMGTWITTNLNIADKDHIKSRTQRYIFYLEGETFKLSCS